MPVSVGEFLSSLIVLLSHKATESQSRICQDCTRAANRFMKAIHASGWDGGYGSLGFGGE
jgi:hypothetical protein